MDASQLITFLDALKQARNLLGANDVMGARERLISVHQALQPFMGTQNPLHDAAVALQIIITNQNTDEETRTHFISLLDETTSVIQKEIQSHHDKAHFSFLKKATTIVMLIASALGLASAGTGSLSHDLSKPAVTVEGLPRKIRGHINPQTYDSLSVEAREIYTYQPFSWGKPFVLIDKPTATGYVFDAQHHLVAKFPVVLGRVRGDERNTVNMNIDSTFTGKATTPAGVYALQGTSLEDLRNYNNNIFHLKGGGALAIHETWPKDLKNRERALRTPSPDDNRLSWGCVNVNRKIFEQYIKHLPMGTLVWITHEADPSQATTK